MKIFDFVHARPARESVISTPIKSKSSFYKTLSDAWSGHSWVSKADAGAAFDQAQDTFRMIDPDELTNKSRLGGFLKVVDITRWRIATYGSRPNGNLLLYARPD
ncbi:hypothetical protein [Cupriavidus sp. H39]|uniref:hypothetical protein n=1 Tax=Cupriavidus sp. H39 TaxID=3401635 RepID=UPI003D06616F